MPHPEGGPDDLHWVRRMVFLSTRGLTQSEAYLTQRRPETLDKQVIRLDLLQVLVSCKGIPGSVDTDRSWCCL